MMIEEINSLFEEKFLSYKETISQISLDKTNGVVLCNFKNSFFNFDKIAKKYHKSLPTVDMIFFDLEKKYIILVEFKNAQIKSTEKPKIKQKFLDSFSLLNQILNIDKQIFWSLKTYLIFVTNKEKNQGQNNYRNYQSKNDSSAILSYLKNNIILYDFGKYKPWYFDEIKTPFCDEFKELMKNDFNIILK